MIQEHVARIQRLRDRLHQEAVDAILINTRPNSYYYSGFPSSNSLVIVNHDHAYFLTDFRYLAKAQADIGHLEVSDITNADLSELVGKNSVLIGYEGEAPHQAVEQLKKRLSKRKFINMSGALRAIRNIKSAAEIRLISANQKLTETILTGILEEVHLGVQEKDLRAAIRQRQIAANADEAFDSIVAVGANSANPHAIAGNAKVSNGKFLLIDMGTRRNHYHSDMTRTFGIGKLPPKAKEIYEIVLEAQLASLAALKPGVEGRTVDGVARAIIDNAGYGQYFGHGLGHGVGLEIHEGPTLRKDSTDVLEEGMVVTVEPGIYLPGFGGVRIEDTVVITSKGYKNLNTLPKTLAIL